MIIFFRTAKLRKTLCDDKKLRQAYGQMAATIRERLDDLHAASDLSVIATLPQHKCHELSGERKGQFAITLKQPFRLIFEPADEPPASRKSDGGLNWQAIQSISIIEIIDYHKD
jgi:proteic killer suppression protein